MLNRSIAHYSLFYLPFCEYFLFFREYTPLLDINISALFIDKYIL
jgi:hypothetical protein